MDNREIIDNLRLIRSWKCNGDAKMYETITNAINALEQQEKADEWCPGCKEYDQESHCCHRFTKVIRQTVEECKKEWPDSKWYPVEEKLPEDDKEVLVYLFNDSPYITWRSNGRWWTEDFTIEDGDEEAPVAWMPLPDPYKGEKQDG